MCEFSREGGRYLGIVTGSGGKDLCEVKVDGVVHGSIPGGDVTPQLRLADGNYGVQQLRGCVCCPCQTQEGNLLASPSGARTTLASAPDGCSNCCTLRMDSRKLVCALPGDARARLDIVILCAFTAASLLTMPPSSR